MVHARLKREMRTPRGEEWIDLELNIEDGQCVTLFGASGAGKTTVLRMLAGLTQPEEGSIHINGETWYDSRKGVHWPVQQRRVGFVFQENSLFPHMSVRQNLDFACRDKEAMSEIDAWLDLMELKGLEQQRPHQLSGGQKQRVALARTLINRPELVLLDEPLSNLDMRARLELQDVILRAYQKTKVTTILVSHDLGEVFKLAKQVFVLEQGKIVKSGAPQEVFVNGDVSGKFKFTGEIIDIQKDGVVNILTLSIGHNITKVVATDEELEGLTVGSKIIVAAKAFNPLILKA